MSKEYILPDTSVTLLADLGRSTESPRWAVFIKRYESGLRSFLRSKWRYAPADDILQNTYMRLIKALPNYHYTKGQKERFRNYLISILMREAHKWYDNYVRNHPDIEPSEVVDPKTGHIKKKRRRHYKPILKEGEEELSRAPAPFEFEDDYIRNMKKDLAHEATEQILKDTTISERDREIFRCLVLDHEKPVKVAERFDLSRENVDKIKCIIVKATRRRFKDMFDATGLNE